MFGRMQNFAADEAGNVTIDWTVIVAMIVGMSLAVMVLIGGGTTQLSGKTGTELSTRNLGF